MTSRDYPTIALHELALLGTEQRQLLLQRAEENLDPFIEGARPIIDAVKAEGDSALVRRI